MNNFANILPILIPSIPAIILAILQVKQYHDKEKKESIINPCHEEHLKLEKQINERLNSLEEKIDKLAEIDKSENLDDMQRYLTNELTELIHGIKKSMEQKQMIIKTYSTYLKLGGNSWVHHLYDECEKRNLLDLTK